MVFVETSAFTPRVASLLTDEEYADLQTVPAGRPDLGNLIPESGGLRKLRVAAKGHGKSGGARVIYYWAVARDRILLLRAYAKNEQSDSTRTEMRELGRVVEEEFG